MRKMDAGTARRSRFSMASSTRSVAATTAMKALVHELQPVAKPHKASLNIHVKQTKKALKITTAPPKKAAKKAAAQKKH